MSFDECDDWFLWDESVPVNKIPTAQTINKNDISERKGSLKAKDYEQFVIESEKWSETIRANRTSQFSFGNSKKAKTKTRRSPMKVIEEQFDSFSPERKISSFKHRKSVNSLTKRKFSLPQSIRDDKSSLKKSKLKKMKVFRSGVTKAHT